MAIETPGWAEARPWEKYPQDVIADVTIKSHDKEIVLKGVSPEKAHAELLRAYLTTDSDFLRECIDRAAHAEGFGGMSGNGCDATVYYRRPIVITEEMICPRRDEGGPGGYFPTPDHWEKLGDWRCCSYCGSMHPDDVIAAIKKLGRGIAHQSDKRYKWYIELPGVTNASFGPIKFYVMHFSQEQIDNLNTLFRGVT